MFTGSSYKGPVYANRDSDMLRTADADKRGYVMGFEIGEGLRDVIRELAE